MSRRIISWICTDTVPRWSRGRPAPHNRFVGRRGCPGLGVLFVSAVLWDAAVVAGDERLWYALAAARLVLGARRGSLLVVQPQECNVYAASPEPPGDESLLRLGAGGAWERHVALPPRSWKRFADAVTCALEALSYGGALWPPVLVDKPSAEPRRIVCTVDAARACAVYSEFVSVVYEADAWVAVAPGEDAPTSTLWTRVDAKTGAVDLAAGLGAVLVTRSKWLAEYAAGRGVRVLGPDEAVSVAARLLRDHYLLR